MRLGQIGRGGSSRVYQVVDEKNKVFALKKVTLNGADTETVRSYRNEIAMLNRLEGQSRIIKLFSAETNLQKNTILMVRRWFWGVFDLALKSPFSYSGTRIWRNRPSSHAPRQHVVQICTLLDVVRVATNARSRACDTRREDRSF